MSPPTTHHAIDLASHASDARLDRMDRVAVLFGEITAATRQFLAALAESDRHRDWAEEGFGSCAEWLAWRIGINRNTANEKVRAARALEHLPLISRAMGRGELSFSKVRALTRAATPENETELLALAKAGSAAKLERIVRGWKKLERWDEQRLEVRRHASRSFSVFPDDEGMYVVRGRLDPEVGAALMRAVEAASDALFAQTGGGEVAPRDPDAEPDQDARRRRADAIGLVAERALAAGFGSDAPISGSRAERYQVVVHVDESTLDEHGEPGLSEVDDGTRVSAETARRLACDAGRVNVRRGKGRPRTGAGSREGASRARSGGLPEEDTEPEAGLATPTTLDVGRKTRTVPASLRRALEARDRGCRFPGCGSRFTDAHHIHHWADGGVTSLENLVLLCRRHHRRVHEGGFLVCSDRSGKVVFFTRTGRALAAATPPTALSEDPVAALVQANRSRGIAPGPLSGLPKWRRDSAVPWSIEAAALRALDP